MKKDREKKQKYSNITDATIVGAVSEESVLYASANKEYLAILDDKTLGRTLEGISEYKVNPKYQYQNINQQAGFSAELKEQAHVNANNILAGKRERVRQYDDLSSEKKSQVKKFFPNYATPSKNHEIVDYVSVDEKGNVIPGALTQSKFVGRNGAECFEKFFQSLGKGSVPAMIVGAGVANCKVFIDYFRGKIDGTELLKQLGKANTTLISSGAMAVAGQALIPIPVVGVLIGGLVGAVLSETCFNALLKACEEAKLARQRRIEIEKECREIIKLLEAY